MAPTGKAAAPSSKKKSFSFSAALPQTPQQDPRRIDLTGHRPQIDTLDPALQDLKSLRQLSLSTNAISSIQNIPEKLELLSLGRNAIKRLDGVGAATALEQYVAAVVRYGGPSPAHLSTPTFPRPLYLLYDRLHCLRHYPAPHVVPCP